MGNRLEPQIEQILIKAEDMAALTRDEALMLMQIKQHTKAAYALMETANRMSRGRFGAKGENHFHIGLNVEPCPMDCLFCSLTRRAGIFKEKIEFPLDQVLAWARQAEAQGADALNLMTTGTYPFERLLEVGGCCARRYPFRWWPTPGISPTGRGKLSSMRGLWGLTMPCGSARAGTRP
jgi:biotin synthase